MLSYSNKFKIPIIALEGMPRSGKSSVLSRLKKDKRFRVLPFHEIYFSQEQLDTLDDKKGTIKESKWFLDQEAVRRLALDFIDLDPFDLIVADRMYLSTFAYCYARSKLYKNENEFIELVNYFIKNNHKFINYDKIILFNNNPEASVSDRRFNKSAEDMKFWVDMGFMNFYKSFYTKEIYKYIKPNLIAIIETEGKSMARIYKEVRCIIRNIK